eukprot:360685-Chlamydomonas_euryale.AAC.6
MSPRRSSRAPGAPQGLRRGRQGRACRGDRAGAAEGGGLRMRVELEATEDVGQIDLCEGGFPPPSLISPLVLARPSRCKSASSAVAAHPRAPACGKFLGSGGAGASATGAGPGPGGGCVADRSGWCAEWVGACALGFCGCGCSIAGTAAGAAAATAAD